MVGDAVTFYLGRGPEALPTLWARVTNGGVTVMAQALVFHQTGGVRKAASALGAAERPCTCVRPPMLSQVLALGEAATTVPAGVRTLPRMDALVLDQVGAPTEALATVTADVGLLTCVGAPVLHQV